MTSVVLAEDTTPRPSVPTWNGIQTGRVVNGPRLSERYLRGGYLTLVQFRVEEIRVEVYPGETYIVARGHRYLKDGSLSSSTYGSATYLLDEVPEPIKVLVNSLAVGVSDRLMDLLDDMIGDT